MYTTTSGNLFFAAYKDRDSRAKWHIADQSPDSPGWRSLCGFGGARALAVTWQGQCSNDSVCAKCRHMATKLQTCVRCGRQIVPMPEELLPTLIGPHNKVEETVCICATCQADDPTFDYTEEE